MDVLNKDKILLAQFHERQLRTLEQGINDIQCCCRNNRLHVLFLYDDNEPVRGIIIYMDSKYLTIRNKNYYYDKIKNIYSYFTLQLLNIDIIKTWYESDIYDE